MDDLRMPPVSQMNAVHIAFANPLQSRSRESFLSFKLAVVQETLTEGRADFRSSSFPSLLYTGVLPRAPPPWHPRSKHTLDDRWQARGPQNDVSPWPKSSTVAVTLPKLLDRALCVISSSLLRSSRTCSSVDSTSVHASERGTWRSFSKARLRQ